MSLKPNLIQNFTTQQNIHTLSLSLPILYNDIISVLTVFPEEPGLAILHSVVLHLFQKRDCVISGMGF